MIHELWFQMHKLQLIALIFVVLAISSAYGRPWWDSWDDFTDSVRSSWNKVSDSASDAYGNARETINKMTQDDD